MIQRRAKINNVDALFLEIVRLSDRHCVFSKNYQKRLQSTLAQNKHLVSEFDGMISLFEKLWDEYPHRNNSFCFEKSDFNYCVIKNKLNQKTQASNEKIMKSICTELDIEAFIQSSSGDPTKKIPRAETMSKHICIKLDEFYTQKTDLSHVEIYLYEFFKTRYGIFRTRIDCLPSIIIDKIAYNVRAFIDKLKADDDWNSKISVIAIEAICGRKVIHTDNTVQEYTNIVDARINKNIHKKSSANIEFFKTIIHQDVRSGFFDRIDSWLQNHAHKLDIDSIIRCYMYLSNFTEGLNRRPHKGPPPTTLIQKYLDAVKPSLSTSKNVLLGAVINNDFKYAEHLLQTFSLLLITAPYSTKNFKKHQTVNAFDFCEDAIQNSTKKQTNLHLIRDTIRHTFEHQRLNLLIPEKKYISPVACL